jgi:hypothetical protein
MEETWLGFLARVDFGVVSASYDRISNGAYVPVAKLGPKILG